MTVLSLLSVFNYGLVLVYGLVLTAEIAGGCAGRWQRGFLAGLCAAFLAVQFLCWQLFGFETVQRLYPLIVHLPLCLALVLVLKKPLSVAAVSTCTGYLCCQIPNWGRAVAEALSGSPLVGQICYTLLIVPVFVLLLRHFARAAYDAMTCSPTALPLFGSLPVAYYCFDYATTIYSDALYAQTRAVSEALPTALIVFYLLFLTAYHVQSQRRSEAENQRSVLEMELRQSQTEMNALRAAATQTAVYQHDMRHHLNMLGGLLADGKTAQAEDYIRRVTADVEAVTPRRFCENELLNLLCSDFAARAEKSGVTFRVDVKLPQTLAVADTELCALLSNALENALRAASALPEDSRWVSLYCALRLGKLLIEVENPYDGEVKMQGGLPVSDRDGHGYGCRSIRSIAQRAGGICDFSARDGLFRLQLALPVKQ